MTGTGAAPGSSESPKFICDGCHQPGDADHACTHLEGYARWDGYLTACKCAVFRECAGYEPASGWVAAPAA